MNTLITIKCPDCKRIYDRDNRVWIEKDIGAEEFNEIQCVDCGNKNTTQE